MKEGGVSEVVGAIILVSIAVLAVGIAVLVLFTGPLPTQIPAFSGLISNSGKTVYISHEGGDPLPVGQFKILVDGSDRTASFTSSLSSGIFSLGMKMNATLPSTPRRVVLISNTSRGGETVLLAANLVRCIVPAQPGWFSGDWSYRKRITIDHAKVSGSLSSFPVLISLPSDLNLSSCAQPDGHDILFTDDSGTAKIPHEIESYTSSTGALLAWVKVPSVNSVSNTTLYLYYNNSDAPDQQDATHVWDSNFVGVWHLREPTGSASNDSTLNGLTGTPSGSPGQTPGQVDGSLSFSGSSVSMGNNASFNFGTGAFTASSWVRGGGGNQQILGKSNWAGNDNGIQIYTNASGAMYASAPPITNSAGVTTTGVATYPTAKVMTSNGGASIDTSQSKFGGASGKFVAASSQVLTTPDSPDWAFGTGDFTIDCWVRFNSLQTSGTQYMWAQDQNNNNRQGFYLTYRSGLRWGYWANSGGTALVEYETPVRTLSTGTWYHVAVVRRGSNWYIFENGVNTGATLITGDASASIPDYNGEVRIGQSGPSLYLDGWIDEERVSKGIARWTAAFTPPTARYDHDGYTVLLLHMDGTGGSTSFTDDVITGQAKATRATLPDADATIQSMSFYSHATGNFRLAIYNDTGVTKSSNTVTSLGGASMDTSQSKFGGASGYFDGSGDYLTIPDSNDWHFGNFDFTIDFWVRLGAAGANYKAVFHQGETSGNMQINSIEETAAGGMRWLIRDASTTILDISTSGITLSAGTWYHVAAVRSGNNFNIYINGVSYASGTSSSVFPNIPYDVHIANRPIGPYYYNGYIDELRVSKGIARWTSGFTPPSVPYMPDPYTVLLLHMDGLNRGTSFIDDSGDPVGWKLWESGDTPSTAEAWNTVTIPAGLALKAGTYWLAWQWNSISSGPSFTAGSSGDGNYVSQAYGSFPASWISGTGSGEKWSIYATYIIPVPIGSNDGTWHYLVVTRSGTGVGQLTTYYDGIPVDTGSDSRTLSNTDNFRLALSNDGLNGFGGYLDEVRVSSTARNGDWIRTEYNNQYSPGTFAYLNSSEQGTC